MPAQTLPNYEIVPLRSDIVRVGVIQSRNNTIDPKHAERDRKANVEHMCELIDYAQDYGVRSERMKDFVVFHEFPITGWPGQYVNTGFILNPKGEIVLKNWKRRNTPGSGYSTTVYDILDKFVEIYGWDAIFPVARTDIGNLAIQPEIFEPEFVRTLAMKGAELFIRYYTSGVFRQFDVPVQCATNKIYGIFINQAVYEGDCRFEDANSGGSAIFDDAGNTVVEVRSHHETMASATIPMASFRKRHSIPTVYKDLFMPQWDKYQCKFAPNGYLTESLPTNKRESIAHYQKIARW